MKEHQSLLSQKASKLIITKSINEVPQKEFKLGGREIEEGAKHLIEIKSLVSQFNKSTKNTKLREPDLMMVITGGPIRISNSFGRGVNK